MDVCNANDETCFHVASRHGHTEILRLLLDLGEKTIRETVRSVEQKENKQNLSTVALAICNDHLDTAVW